MIDCPNCDRLRVKNEELRSELKILKDNLKQASKEGHLIDVHGGVCRSGTSAYYRECDRRKGIE